VEGDLYPSHGWVGFSHGMAKVIMNLNICKTMRHRMERDLISMSRCKNLQVVVVGSLIEYNMLA